MQTQPLPSLRFSNQRCGTRNKYDALDHKLRHDNTVVRKQNLFSLFKNQQCLCSGGWTQYSSVLVCLLWSKTTLKLTSLLSVVSYHDLKQCYQHDARKVRSVQRDDTADLTTCLLCRSDNISSVPFYAQIRKQNNNNIHDVSNAFSLSQDNFSMKHTGQQFKNGKATEFSKQKHTPWF